MVLAILFVLIVGIAYSPGGESSKPAELLVEIDFPALVPNQPTAVYAQVSNRGGDARNFEVLIQSTGLASQTSSKLTIPEGTSVNVEITVSADDVKNGLYAVVVTWRYEDSTGTHSGGSIQTTLYVLPLAQMTDFRWLDSIFGLGGKSEIKKTQDETKLFFKVRSQSRSALYSGLTCVANFTIEAPNLFISPASISVEPLGPQGPSVEYNFTISSLNAFSGTYPLTIYLYSGGFLVEQHTVELKVVPE